MRKSGWLLGLLAILILNGFILVRDSVVFKIDGEWFRYDALPGYCSISDKTIVENWFTGTDSIGFAVFYPCRQSEVIDKGEWDSLSGWILISTPMAPELRNFDMSREQFLQESQKLVSMLIIGDKQTKYYGDRQVSENFKRPTPLLIADDSDQYAVYQSGPYFTEMDKGTIKRATDQVTATTLIKGKVINIQYYEVDFEHSKRKAMLKRLKENTKVFVKKNGGDYGS